MPGRINQHGIPGHGYRQTFYRKDVCSGYHFADLKGRKKADRQFQHHAVSQIQAGNKGDQSGDRECFCHTF